MCIKKNKTPRIKVMEKNKSTKRAELCNKNTGIKNGASAKILANFFLIPISINNSLNDKNRTKNNGKFINATK